MITSNNRAVAGVIEALLLVALAAIIVSTIQLIYVPEAMEQRESQHMDDVSNQFSTLKSMIDLQGMTNSSAPISTMLTLGSPELPYFITAPSYGQLTVDDSGDHTINLDYGAFHYDLTSITYEAHNSYYLDQTYILEGGGIIVEQQIGTPVMLVSPSISANNGTDLDISLYLPIFDSPMGKNITYGYTSCFIRTTRSGGNTQHYSSLSSINITTLYPEAWREALYDTLEDNVIYHIGPNYIEITPNLKDIDLDIRYYTIDVQVGQGWVKS